LAESIPLARPQVHTLGMNRTMRLVVGSAIELAGLAVVVGWVLG
jgi:hypothetical protein